jgi:hypothetical protein
MTLSAVARAVARNVDERTIVHITVINTVTMDAGPSQAHLTFPTLSQEDLGRVANVGRSSAELI